MTWEQFWQTIQNWATTTGIKIVIAIVILIVSFAIINRIAKGIASREKKLEATGKVDKTLYRTLSYIFKIILKISCKKKLCGARAILHSDRRGISRAPSS